jgi:hypothetical protein
MSADAYEQMTEQIEKRLARKKHADLLRVLVQVLKDDGEEGVRKEMKSRLSLIKEE